MMRSAVLWFWLTIFPAAALGQSGGLTAELDRLLGKLPDARATVSACVIRLPDGQTIYRKNADQPMIPASNQKIITAAAALETLGLEFAYETRLYRYGDSLLLVGSGDPALGDPRIARQQDRSPTDTFHPLADRLIAENITTIEGDLLIDDFVFENQWTHASWEPNDIPKWYAAPVGGLNFNDNCIEVTVRPAQSGKPVLFEMFPPNDWIEIDNRCVTGAKDPWIVRKNHPSAFELRGQCAKTVTLASVSVADPGIFTGQVLRKVLADRGIVVKGVVRRPEALPVPAPDPVDLLADHRTPLHLSLQRALRDSQNLFAECLMKTLSRHGQPQIAGNWRDGQRRILETLRKWNIATEDMVIADGSGLSRDNRASADQITQILKHMYLAPKTGGLFIDCMSSNGQDGTLQKRMKELPGKVWAKTGYIRGVRSLSGYVMSTDNQWYAFSVIFNDIPGGTAPYNQIHDRICALLARSAR